MNDIVMQTSIQAAASIYMSCKYWRNKYEHIINHDAIVILFNERYIKVRSWTFFTIKNGCGKSNKNLALYIVIITYEL
jgi:hypothetical protein